MTPVLCVLEMQSSVILAAFKALPNHSLFHLIFNSHHKAFKVAVDMSSDHIALCTDVMSDLKFSVFI